MVTHRWKYVGCSDYAEMWVDYNNQKTRIKTKNYIYLHNGIYPYHDPDYTRKYRR